MQMASQAQMNRRKIATPRSPSGHQHDSSSLPVVDNLRQNVNHSRSSENLQIERNSVSSSSLIADDSAITFQFGNQYHQSSLNTDLKQQWTFKSLYNITQNSSPRPTQPASMPHIFVSGSDSLSFPSAVQSNPLGPFPPSISRNDQKNPLGSVNTDKHAITIPSGTQNFSQRSNPDITSESASSQISMPDVHSEVLSSFRSLALSNVSEVSEVRQPASPYNLRDELAPDAPFFSTKFQTALQSGLSIAKDALTVLDKVITAVPSQNSLKNLHSQARELSLFHGSSTRTIALLGDSGEGKSTLINSLLNLSEVAKTSNIGSACTSVVTEYRQKKTNQKGFINLEIEYFSSAQIEEVIKGLLWDFRKFYLPHVESPKTSAEDYIRWQRESQQAWSALEPAFKHRKQFSQEFIKDMSDGAHERITEQLIQWAGELQWPEGARDGMWSSTASSVDECCEQTSMFMQDRYWPFTKIIRVFLDAQILRTGLVLADLPGLHDTNFARVCTTHDYLLRCDLFLIVANISRAITNQSLKSSLYTVLSQHAPLEWEETGGKAFHFAVVCTMADNFDIEKEKREFYGPKNPTTQSLMVSLDTQIKQAKKVGNRDLKKNLKKAQKIMVLEARNLHVQTGLRNAYSKDIPNAMLPVFCVSNSWYQKYSKKGSYEMVRASGIPELRRFCLSLTAQIRLLESQNFLQTKLLSLLNSMDIWKKDALPRVNEIPKLPLEVFDDEIRMTQKQIERTIQDAKADYLLSFEETFFRYFAERPQFWQLDASKRHNQWTTWHWTQYNAWCTNNGRHETPKRKFLNWNSEIIWKMRSEIAYDWSILEEDIPSVFSDLLEEMRTRLLRLKALTNKKGLPALVGTGIQLRINDLDYQTGLQQHSFSRQMQHVRRMALEPAGFVLSEMSPAYRAAAEEHGTGKSSRQKEHVGGKIEDGTLFPNIAFQIRSSIEPLLDTTFNNIKNVFQDTLERIKEDISMAIQSSSNKSQRHESELRAVSTIAQALEELKERHSDVLRDSQV